MENKIGLNIKKYRLDQKLSQDQLAEKVYSTKSTISKWESGDIVPSVDVLKIVAKALNVSVYKIMDEKQPWTSKVFNFLGKFLFWGFVWVHVDVTFVGVVLGVAVGMFAAAFFAGIGGFAVQLTALIMNGDHEAARIAVTIGYLIWTPLFMVVFGGVGLLLYTIGRSVHMFSRKFFWRYPKGSFKMNELAFFKKITKTQWIIFGSLLAVSVAYFVGIAIYESVNSQGWADFNITFK